MKQNAPTSKKILLLLIMMCSIAIHSQWKHSIAHVPAQSITNTNDLDTDGDGIIDSIDIDDDNDGIIDELESAMSQSNQVYDSDSDGIPNALDLDADNDGIPDIEEAGFKILSNGNATVDRTVWIDLNSNGLHDSIDEMIANGTYKITDSDNDGVPDFLDLDSDNDTLFDVDEAGETNGDGDTNGDGNGDGADSDGDGILDVFDNFHGFGTHFRPAARNTRNREKPDYQITDSNAIGIFDITQTLYANLDANQDGMIDDTVDLDKDGIMDVFDTDVTTAGSPRNLNSKLFVEFDGRNDYGDSTQLLSGLNQSTMMGWIKLNANNQQSVVMGQDNFLLSVKTGNRLSATANGVTLINPQNLSPNTWYHIAAVYNGNDSEEKLKLYVNGKKEMVSNAGALAGTLHSSALKFTFAKNAAAENSFFKGGIDEVRVFDVALTDDQLQKMVYQEITSNNGAIRGEVIPKDIENTAWTSLIAYYKMDVFSNDSTVNRVNGLSTSDNNAKIYNVKRIAAQLAPMPFVTTQSGSLDTAVSSNNFVNGMDAMTNEWAIVKVTHNITLPYNHTALGMIIEPGATVILDNDNKIKNTWYLKLDGKIDLKGHSQLVQTQSSELDATSSGYIEKDQQGQTNIYNYNYWSSPVGSINNFENNSNFTVNGVLRDATNPENLQNINWVNTVNGAPTSPISLSSFWINTYQNLPNNAVTSNWYGVGANGILSTGQGFTLKGSGASGSLQNYTFVGKPNNGEIVLPQVSHGGYNLIGNPYPSALDADQFIKDNLGEISGTLYFWEQYTTNNTHYLADYQGGYAVRTLVGGTPPISPPEFSNNGGASNRVPGRYIPVGQSFLIMGGPTVGNIRFTNNQRAFIKETNAYSNELFKSQNTASSVLNNNDDEIDHDNFVKIRMGCDMPSNFHRQILIGFMNENATSGNDVGYDAVHIDTQPYDMYFVLNNENMTIQGVGHFNVDDVYPLGVKCQLAGNVKFTLDQIENLNANQPIYIYDNVTQLYHDIRNQSYNVDLPAGRTNNRFSLRFKDPEAILETLQVNLDQNIFVAYANENKVITIKNNLSDSKVESVKLFNMLGQSINNWNVANELQTKINIPVANLSSGTYIIKVHTLKGDLTKKIVIR